MGIISFAFLRDTRCFPVDSRFSNISMNGRMAYVIMCVESYLKNTYPEKDWSLLSEAMWKATNMNWGDWSDLYCGFIPEVIFQYSSYDSKELSSSYSEEVYNRLLSLYLGLTEGREDDDSDELNYLINKPFEMAMVYEGTGIGDGIESVEIIQKAERILINHKIELPGIDKICFSSINDCNGWGNDFDGTYLSIILNH